MSDANAFILKRMREIGFSPLPSLPNIDAVVDHLRAKPTYGGHVKVYDAQRAGTPTRCHAMEDVITAPGFFAYAAQWAPLLRDYFEVETPRLYSVNAFWTLPGGDDVADVMHMHADHDDSNFAAMFIFGTDVLTELDGAHRFTRRDGTVTSIMGTAGTAFLTDPRQQHCGIHPATKPRLLLWARWGVSNPPNAYLWDDLRPVTAGIVPGYADLAPWIKNCVELVAR